MASFEVRILCNYIILDDCVNDQLLGVETQKLRYSEIEIVLIKKWMYNGAVDEADRNDMDLDDFVSAIEGDGEKALVAGVGIAGKRRIDVLGAGNLVGRGVALGNEFVDHGGPPVVI